ncbi:hypothetical protein IscW_ISCW023196, partial [Ixodes scapularis]
PKASNPPRQGKPVVGRSAPPTYSRRRHQSHWATMVPKMHLRLPRLPRPKKWSLDLCPTTLWQHRVVAGRDLGAINRQGRDNQHTGLRYVICCHFGTTFGERDAKHAGRREKRSRCHTAAAATSLTTPPQAVP